MLMTDTYASQSPKVYSVYFIYLKLFSHYVDNKQLLDPRKNKNI